MPFGSRTADCGHAESGLGVVCVRARCPPPPHAETPPPPVSAVFAMKRAKALRIPRACGMYHAFVEQRGQARGILRRFCWDFRSRSAEIHGGSAQREFTADLRNKPTADLREFRADLREFRADLREFRADLRKFTADLREFTADLREFTRNGRNSADVPRCSAALLWSTITSEDKITAGPGYSERFCSLHCKHRRKREASGFILVK